MEKTLAIFNEEYQVVAFLSVVSGNIALDFQDKSWERKLQDILAEAPTLRDEEITDEKILLVERPVDTNDPNYLYAVRQSLEEPGILSYIVVTELKEILVLLSSERVTREQREAVLGDVVNMTAEQANIFSESLKMARES